MVLTFLKKCYSLLLFLHCQVVMLVYDITNYSSFENLDDWLAIIKRECFKSDTTPPHLALVANKSTQHYELESYSTHCIYLQWIWST